MTKLFFVSFRSTFSCLERGSCVQRSSPAVICHQSSQHSYVHYCPIFGTYMSCCHGRRNLRDWYLFERLRGLPSKSLPEGDREVRRKSFQEPATQGSSSRMLHASTRNRVKLHVTSRCEPKLQRIQFLATKVRWELVNNSMTTPTATYFKQDLIFAKTGFQ